MWYNQKLVNACRDKPSQTLKIIRKARLRRKLDPARIEDVAQVMGISPNMLTAIEHGNKNMLSKELAVKLLKLYDVDVDVFISILGLSEPKTEPIKIPDPQPRETHIVVQNGLDEPIQIIVREVLGEIRIEIEPTVKQLKDAVWIPPASVMYESKQDKFKPERRVK